MTWRRPVVGGWAVSGRRPKGVRGLRGLAVVLAAVLLLGALSGCARRALDLEQVGPDDKIVVKFSHVTAENTPKGLAARRFAALVKERSGGRVEVQVFPNGQLYNDDEEMAALERGNVQVIAPSISKLSGRFPQWQVFDLPYAFPDEHAVVRAMEGDIGRHLFSLIRSRRMLGLAMWDNGFKHMTNNRRPLIRPEDFRGLTFRVQPSRVLAAQFAAVGASSVPIPFNDVFAALAQGRVDGQENTASNIRSKRFHEVQRYMTVSAHGYLGYAVITNASFWESLPVDVRAILEEGLAEATRWMRENAARINEIDLRLIRESGQVRVHVLTDEEKRAWMDAMDPVYDLFAEQIGPDLIAAVRALRRR